MTKCRSKKYRFEIGGVKAVIDATVEGEHRFMVRMSLPGRMHGPVRIGYLTGRERTWLAEFFGNHPSAPAVSAKEACAKLAEYALAQPSISPFLKRVGNRTK